jgi:hypothetical protein
MPWSSQFLPEIQGWFNVYKVLNVIQHINRSEVKPIDTEKVLHKIQCLFMIKALMKVVIQGMYLNTIKSIYEKPIVNIVLNGKKTKIISSKVRNETSIFTLSSPFQHSLGILNQDNKTGRGNKRNINRKGRNQTTSVCR